MATDNLPIAHYSSADVATTLEAFTNKPYVVPELRKSFGQGILTFDLIGLMKNDNNFVGDTHWDVHEELPPFRTMTIGSTVSGGAATGDAITFDLAAGDVDQYYHYYPRAGQSFWAGSAQLMVEMVIHTVTATGLSTGATIVAYKKDSTANTTWHPADYIKAGQTFALSPAVNAGEGTAATTPTHTGYQEFTFYMQVLKDAIGWENAELARSKWVEVEGGKIYNKELARMDTNLDAAMEAAIWFGTKTTNAALVQASAATGSNVAVTGTQGIWDWIGERGYDIDFTNTTDFTIEHFYELSEYGESVGLPSGTWLFSAGGDLMRRIEKSCKSYITNATGSLNELFTPDAGGGLKDLTVGFRSISLNAGGTKVILQPNHIFNNPYLFGISTYGIKDAAACFPLMDVNTKGGRVPNLSLKYRGLPGYGERKRCFAPFLGVGGPKGIIGGPTVLTGDLSTVHALVDFGVEYLEAWRGVRVFNTDITNSI